MNNYLSKLSKLLLLISPIVCCSSITHADPATGFALSEHWAMGQQVKLQFDIDQAPEITPLLHLDNGLTLSFGDIISLGDLYGIVGRPISHAIDKSTRKIRFREVFNTLAQDPKAVSEANDLNAVIKIEAREIESGIAHGETAEMIYKRIGNTTARQVNCITGGGCNRLNWWLQPGRYLQLAIENYDHFAPNSVVAYKAGHQVALDQALKAKKTGQRKDLELAYAMDAFASHYLSDHFAAGHIRTPREELNATASNSVMASLLAIYMHDEENHYGLHVSNNAGDQWVVYGDHSYFNPSNQMNQQLLLKAIQQSVDDIFNTYTSGNLPHQFAALELVPHAEALNSDNNLDIAPLFYWDNDSKQLLRRTEIANPFDHHWTNSWWGWSTIILLKTQYGITSTIQLSLSKYLSEYRHELETQAVVG